MHCSRSLLAIFSSTALALLLAPRAANASPPPGKAPRLAHSEHSVRGRGCAKPPIVVVAGAETATFSLAQCDGTASPSGVDQLSVLARPAGVQKPTAPLALLEKTRGAELAARVRRVDARLVERLETVADHFRNDRQPVRVVVVSGYRARSSGSYHSAGRALDFRIDGVPNDALVAYCKTLPDTGCGYYPNDVFVHMDVRDSGAGHVAWVDKTTSDFSRSGSGPAAIGQATASAAATAEPAPAPPSDLPAAMLAQKVTSPLPTLPSGRLRDGAPAARKATGDRHFL